MTYTAENVALWNPIIQIGAIAIAILLANVLRRRVGFFKKSLLPTAVLAGFLLLFAKLLGIFNPDIEFLESLTYHGIAIGFIAMSLRVPEKTEEDKENLIGLKSGAVIVGSYMIQGATGLIISILLALTFMPNLFVASGLLLPLGYGQGPGQANNIGLSYEAMGFAGGRSFGLALATAGYLCACIVGVIYINYLVKKGKIQRINHEELSGSATIEMFQHEGEVPMSESLDRFSIQGVLVVVVYLATYLLTWGFTSFLTAYIPGIAKLLNSLMWGFNFIIGSALAILTRILLKKMRKAHIVNHQYQNNYLLSRISGLAFDVMIVAAVASIEINDLSGLWVPFIIMAIAGGIITFFHLRYSCKKVYGSYYYEGLLSMYGMMTGTISSGILLLRELDPNFETPAANNLVLGSSFAILLGAPLMILVTLATQSFLMTCITLAIIIAYYFVLIWIINIKRKHKESNK